MCFLVLVAFAFQRTDRLERFLTMSKQAEERGLAEPFRGITTAEGAPEKGLFAIRSTGVSTEPVRAAASAFLKSLTDEQRAKTVFPVDDPEWRKWMNQHFYIRQGAGFKDMTEPQREAAFGLLKLHLLPLRLFLEAHLVFRAALSPS